jgi:beta-galactosidase
MKWPGVLDTFRVPKPGAAIYRSQVPPSTEVVLEPAFYWYFGEGCPLTDLAEAMICSNCEEVRVSLDGEERNRLRPDRDRFGNLEWPPFFLPLAGLLRPGCERSDLGLDGYIGGQLVVRRRLSADVAHDRLSLEADDTEIVADGVDATRVVARVVDRFGWTRPRAQGEVEMSLEGPGEFVGEGRFSLEDGGPVRAVWVSGRAGEPGLLRLVASHGSYGAVEVSVTSK